MRAILKLGSILLSTVLAAALGLAPAVQAQDAAQQPGANKALATELAKEPSLVEKVEALTAKMTSLGKGDKPFRIEPPRLEKKEAASSESQSPVASPASPKFSIAGLSRQKNLAQYIQETFAVPESKAKTIVNEAFRNAKENNIHPELILAVIAVESTFKEKAKNAGAMGLMQIIPRYHKQKIAEIGGSRQLLDPAKNIRVGTRIFMDYLQSSSGNIRSALIRYNGSLSARAYASKILDHYRRLRQIAGQD